VTWLAKFQFTKALWSIFPPCPTGFPFPWASSDLGWMTMSQNTSMQMHVYIFVASTVFWMVVTAKLWKTIIMAMKGKNLDFNMKLEIIHRCAVGCSSKSKVGRQYGLISLTLFMVLKIGNTVCTKSKQTNTAPFLHEYILV
jgi:hypothetical protein